MVLQLVGEGTRIVQKIGSEGQTVSGTLVKMVKRSLTQLRVVR